MIKVIYGNKGICKTKYLIADANGMLKDCMGDVVFLNHDNSLITDLRHEIRYVNTSDFPISNLSEMFAFLCGMIAENYDIKAVYLDGLDRYVTKQCSNTIFFDKIKNLSEKYEIKFVFSISGDISGVPDFVNKEYTC
jgi:hypothetical protein